MLALGGVLLLGVRPARSGPAPRLRPKAGAVAADSTVEGAASHGVGRIQPPAISSAPVTPAVANALATRVARTWVNVRGRRGRSTPTVRVLDPGDAVQVDSLHRGWYRVLIDGRAAGYVHRSNLDPVSPPR